jgi:molybdopterin converting factor small subunit
MPVIFHIPGPLRAFSGGRGRVELDASPATLRDALESLWRAHPGLRDRVVTEQGAIREHIGVFVGKENSRYTGELSTPVGEGAEISILPQVSGG